MLHNIDTSLLRTFVTLAETRNFTRSAQILFRTQSAITMQLQKLEDLLGCKLASRSGRQLELTEEGIILLGYAVQILRLNDEMQVDITQSRSRDEIHVGTSDDYAVMLLPAIIDEFVKIYPNTSIVLSCFNRDKNLEKFNKGEIDVLLIPTLLDEKLGETIRPERMVWVGSQETRLADDAPVPLAGFPVGCLCRDLMIRSLNQANRRWSFVYSSNSIVSIHSAIGSGRVISAVEESTVPGGARILNGAFNLPELPDVKLSVMRRRDQPNRLHHRFYEHLRDTMGGAGRPYGLRQYPRRDDATLRQ